jgi:hypothetical protein
LRRNCLLKHLIQGKIDGRIEVTKDEEEDVSSYWMTLNSERTLEIEIGNTGSHSMEKFI